MPNGEEEEMSFGVSLWSVGVAAVVLLLPVGSGEEEKRKSVTCYSNICAC